MKMHFLSYFILLVIFRVYSDERLNVRNVHGKFERTQVTELSEFRNQVTGLLYDAKAKSTCTGILIGPKHVLTAAHCVYNFATKTWSDKLEFTPGKLSKDDKGSGTFSYKKIFIKKEYIQSMKEEHDFALIELDSAIGETLGWVGFRSLKADEMINDNAFSIVFSGYPGDKEFGSLWSVTCPAVVTEELLTYFCDSYGGMSGSPIFQIDDTQNFVIGVHTYGSLIKNGGVFFNGQDFNLISAWKNLSKYPSNTIIHLKK